MDRYEQFRSVAIDRGMPEDEVGRFAEHLRFAVWAWPGKDGEVQYNKPLMFTKDNIDSFNY